MLTKRAFGLATASAAAVLLLGAASGQAQVNKNWLTVVMPAEPAGLEGCSATRQLEGFVNKETIVETLLDKNMKTGEIVPRLATSWEQVNPLTWRFKLRQGVKFHDGADFNAETAIKSMERLLKSPVSCEIRNKYFNNIKMTLSAPDAFTVQIVTENPEPILPARMTAMTIVSPNTPFDKATLTAIGTGAFAMEEWKSGQEIRVKRFDAYWGAKPQAEGVRYIWRAEPAVRAAMAKIGEADIVPVIGKQDANDPTLDHSYLTWEVSFLRIDNTRAPLDDRRVRLALNYAVDREGMRGTILSKDVVNATQIVVPGVPGHNYELDKNVRPFDPTKAKQLLAEAKADGVPVDKEIILYGGPTKYPGASEVAEALLTSYRAVGLNMKLINLEPGQYTEQFSTPHDPDRGPTLLQVLHDNTLEPIISVPYKYACDGTSSMVCDKGLDEQINKIAAMTGEERNKAWSGLFKHLYEDVVADVWMYYMVGYQRLSPRMNYKPDLITNNEIRVQEYTFK